VRGQSYRHSQSGVFSLVMTLSVRDIVVGTQLLIAFGFPVMWPLMSLVLFFSEAHSSLESVDFLDLVWPSSDPLPTMPPPPPASSPPSPPPPPHPFILHHYTHHPCPSLPSTSSPSVLAEPSCSAVSLFEPSTYRDVVHPKQHYGRDYEQIFAPVAQRTTVHTLIVVTSIHQWAISQLHMKNAFLHGELHVEVYLHEPLAYFVLEGHVCRLHYSLYGLKQAPHAWFE
jgi:hypothetical protein